MTPLDGLNENTTDVARKKNKDKIRTDFRKNRGDRTRKRGLTRRFRQDGLVEDESAQTERISGKGDLSRRRTVVGTRLDDDEAGLSILPEVDEALCVPGRVLEIHGLASTVAADDGALYRCATRRLLKTLQTDQRHVVAVGDRVQFRPQPPDEGIIERVEPRHGVLCRTSRGRQHVIVANVDQLLIITSAAEPALKPNLIDRFLITAEKGGIRPIICINKIDLVDPADLQPLVGVYGQMGYRVQLLSATRGIGIERFSRTIAEKRSVVAGQSGVGKSSLLNAVDPNLQLAVNDVSHDTQKGRHTTSAARLIPLSIGGHIVDTPGIRQFELWDVIPEEVAGFFRDIRPLITRCKYPNCTHTHEDDCAVKYAVADGKLDTRRYESYCHLVEEP